MTTSELKLNIQKKLNSIENIEILKEVDSIINFMTSDKADYDELPDDVKSAIEEGLAQLENGNKISYEEVKKRNAKWFTK